jgi:hypothetical protein
MDDEENVAANNSDVADVGSHRAPRVFSSCGCYSYVSLNKDEDATSLDAPRCTIGCYVAVDYLGHLNDHTYVAFAAAKFYFLKLGQALFQEWLRLLETQRLAPIPYPIGTATTFHINTGAALAGKQIRWPITAMTEQRVVGQLWRVECTASYCLIQRERFSPNCSTFPFVLKANPFLWTALIRVHFHLREDCLCDNALSFTFSAFFRACGAVLDVDFGRQIQAQTILFGRIASDLYLGNIRGYPQ